MSGMDTSLDKKRVLAKCIRRVVGFDVEASGKSCIENELISVGFGVVNGIGETVTKKLFVFRPDAKCDDEGPINLWDYRWEKRCREEFAEKFEHVLTKTINLEAEYVVRGRRDTVEKQMIEWLHNIMDKYKDIDCKIATDNGPFDARWLNNIMDKHGCYPLEYYKVGDKWEWRGVYDIDSAKDLARDLKNIGVDIKMPENPYTHDHNPVNDALNIAFEAAYLSSRGKVPNFSVEITESNDQVIITPKQEVTRENCHELKIFFDNDASYDDFQERYEELKTLISESGGYAESTVQKYKELCEIARKRKDKFIESQ